MLLANKTANATYLDAAMTSFNFIHNVLYSNEDALVRDEIFIGEKCEIEQVILPTDMGLFIEGVALLGEFTGNETMRNLWVLLLRPSQSRSYWNPRATNLVEVTLAKTDWQDPTTGVLLGMFVAMNTTE